jgi:hypothetical protein
LLDCTPRSNTGSGGGEEIVKVIMNQQEQEQSKMQQPTNDTSHTFLSYYYPSQSQHKFVQVLSHCLVDSTCHILYHHVAKTGGTTMETVFQKVFDAPVPESSCCHANLMSRFRKNKASKWCFSKFSAYQLKQTQDFHDVVGMCADLYSNYTNHNATQELVPHRAVILTTIREPFSRVVSDIHQICNKNPQLRSNQTLEACGRCSYQKDVDFWDATAVNLNNRIYHEILADYQEKAAAPPPPGITHSLLIDTIHLSKMFRGLRHAMNISNGVNNTGKQNAEIISLCNFAMPSAMMRKLQPSQDAYRNLTIVSYS